MADRPLRLPPSSDSKPSKKSTLKERARNALITGTAGGYLGGMLVEGKARVKIPAFTRKLLKLRRKTVGIHGARTGALAGALIGARNRGQRSETVDAVATGGDWKFQKPLQATANHRQPSPTSFSAFIEDMTFGALSKDVQAEVLRFVDAKKGTPVVHYGMGVKELIAKADAVNLASARKALGTLRASRARDEVLGKIKDGSKYILLMNDRIVDGHHFLAKAERGNVTSTLNVLDLTPARLSTGKVTEFGILGAKGNHKRPTILKGVPLPPGMAAFQPPAGVRVTNQAIAKKGMPADWQDKSKARKVGRILESGGTLPDFAVKASGYDSQRDMNKSLRRHELIHSIQSSKRGYRVHSKLRDLVKDEVGAYGTMNRRVKGGNKVLRAANAITGVPLSIGMGIAGNKKLQKRALLRGAQGAALAGGAVAAKKLTEKREFSAKPFAGYNAKRHARTGGLNDTFRKSYNRENGSNLKRPVTTAPSKLKPGSKAAKRRASFCARMGGMKGATSKGGELTPKGAALKRWNCESALPLREFAEAEPRRNRTRDLRDKIGLAKDVAGLGVIGGVGYGAHRLYKKGSAAVAQAGPKIDAAMQQVKDTAAGWKQTADVTNKNVQSVGDLARGVKGKLDRLTQEKTIRARVHARGKKQGKGWLRRMFGKSAKLLGDAPKAKLGILGRMLNDPSPLTQFSDERKAQWNAALLGAAAPVAAGGLVLGTRGGRNALRGLLKRVDKNDPRRVRMAGLVQKRKDASLKRAGDKAVGKAREQFRAEALPKAPKEPGLKDAVKTVRQRAKRKIVNAVANIGAGPAEQKFAVVGVVGDGLRSFAEPRDKLSKARDAALLTAGAAGTGAVVYGAHKLRGLKSSPTLRKGKAIAENVRNATSITADAGRVWNYLKDPVLRPKRIVAGVRRGWKQGVKEGQSAPAPKWAKGAVKIGKKLRLLETQFAIGGLVGSGIGTLIGSQIGERFKYKTRNALKKKLIPKLGQKWGRRVARAGQFIPENAGALAGGVAGSIIGGGIRRKSTEMRTGVSALPSFAFGGNEQLVDIDSSGFIRPLDQLTGRKKGYSRTKVKDYHRIRRTLDSVADGSKKLSPEAVARMKERMKNIRDNPEDAAVGQVMRSALREGGKVAKWTGRGRSLVKDASAHLRGEAREKDQWGRTKKREWEKGWFNNAKGAAAAGGALVGGALLLRAKPKLRARIDRAKRQVTRTVNHAVEGKDLNLLPRMDKKWKSKELKNFQPWSGGQKRGAMTQPWPKTAKGAPVKSGTPKARAKFEKTRDLFSKSAENIAQGAAQANSAKKVKKLAVLGGRLIQLSDDPLDVGWDLRDARGRSARVFAPGAGSRDRRPKKWHEKIDNERKLWGAAALTGTLTGAAATRKILRSGANKELKRRIGQIGAAVKRNYVAKSKPVPKTNVVVGAFKPGTAA